MLENWFCAVPEKRLYRVRWPNGDVELIAAEDDEELFLLLEEELEFLPFDAEIEEVELTVPIRISLKNRLKTITEFMKLPAKRKLSENDLNRVVSNLYGVPSSPIYIH